ELHHDVEPVDVGHGVYFRAGGRGVEQLLGAIRVTRLFAERGAGHLLELQRQLLVLLIQGAELRPGGEEERKQDHAAEGREERRALLEEGEAALERERPTPEIEVLWTTTEPEGETDGPREPRELRLLFGSEPLERGGRYARRW